MDKQSRTVIFYLQFQSDLQNIFIYRLETFGIRAAESFLSELIFRVQNGSFNYELYVECMHLKTKLRQYCSLLIGSYLLVYRITPSKIEVLRAFYPVQL